MSSCFTDVFQNLDINADDRDAMSSMEVIRISTPRDMRSVKIYVNASGNMPEASVRAAAASIRRKIFGDKNINVDIINIANTAAVSAYEGRADGTASGGAFGQSGSASNGQNVNRGGGQGGMSQRGASQASSGQGTGAVQPQTRGASFGQQKSGTSQTQQNGQRSGGSQQSSSASQPQKKQPLPGQAKFRQAANAWTPRMDKKSENPDLIYGYDFKGEALSIKSLDLSTGEAIIKGRVFKPENIKTRNGKNILSFNLTDETDSISCKMFLDDNAYSELEGSIVDGADICLSGTVCPPDNFNKDMTVSRIKGIRKTKPVIKARTDKYSGTKRVELSMHTKMSDMDGIGYFSDYLKLAKSWGWDTICVTDTNSVQGFPDAWHTAQKKAPDMKLVYGVSALLVDDDKDAVSNSRGQSLDDTYVVFDIETTGFSMERCKIIEIGAVKIENGKITDRFSEFIDPEMPIPPHITELTSITDSDVRGRGNYEYWIPRFLDFVKDAPVVGHNAHFDVGFIRHYAALLGMDFDPTVVDTVGLSHMMLKNLYRNKLDNVAKELGVVLTSHHRAVNDAEATAGIFLKFIELLKKQGIEDLDALYEADEMDIPTIHKKHGNNMNMLIKNDLGRTNLYRLISAAHVDYFYQNARMPKSVVNSMREGILIGSGNEDGELYDCLMRGVEESELLRLASFYDYLEIMPPSNIMYLTTMSDSTNLYTREDIVNINRHILELGRKLGKPVIASGDVHFADPKDAVYRKILKYFEISNKGRGGRFSEAKYSAPLFLKTTDEMLEDFREFGDADARYIVIEAPRMLCDMCERIEPVRPDKCPPVIENSDNELRDICYKRAHEMYGPQLPKIVEDRLETELKSIISNGYSVMYIIAQRLVMDSNEHGYIVGSRGSVGSSMVATFSGISEVNAMPPHYRCENCYYVDFDSEEVKSYAEKSGCDMPDKVCPKCGKPLIKDGFNIPFETFLGFSGDKEPDIDLNFAGDYQAKAHAYTEVIFGKGQTFKAGTVGTVQEKTAVGYVLRYNEDHEINDMKRAQIEHLAQGMTEVRRTTGQHPGGIIVLPHGEEINTFTPIQHPANDMNNPITTHFDYHSIDHNLLKLDILGKDDPSMVRMLEDLTGTSVMKLPVGPPEVMELFKSTDSLGIKPEDIGGTPLGTLGIPEFGTDFAIQMLLDAQPKYVSDLIRIAGLAHGTDVWVGNAQKLIQEGKCTIQTAICTRDDIMVYLIAQGLPPAHAFKIMELVRKGKFPKDGKHDEYAEEMKAHGVPDWYIWSCDTIKYMFPKAHAAAYVVMSLRIAWYKVHMPLAYYAVYLSTKAKNFDYETMCVNLPTLRRNIAELRNKIATDRTATAKDKDTLGDMRCVEEMLARGIEFAPIDIKKAKATKFTITDDGRIMPALNAIAGLGDNAAESVEADIVNGDYLSIDEFISRTKVSKTNAELMKQLGILNLPESNQLSLFDGLM